MSNNNYILFLIATLLFFAGAIYSGYIYTSWDNEVALNGDEVEINLPVINWEKYFSLSKTEE